MALTLGNNLTGSSSRQVINANNRTALLGESMTSGKNKSVAGVDAFLGNSLHDKRIQLQAYTKNMSYSSNLVLTAKESLNIISSFLQRGVVTAATAGELSLDKIQTLSEYMSGLKDQVALLIDSTSFDRKKVLNGDATRISVQIGLKDLDRLELRISNLGSGKLFRVGVSKFT